MVVLPGRTLCGGHIRFFFLPTLFFIFYLTVIQPHLLRSWWCLWTGKCQDIKWDLLLMSGADWKQERAMFWVWVWQKRVGKGVGCSDSNLEGQWTWCLKTVTACHSSAEGHCKWEKRTRTREKRIIGWDRTFMQPCWFPPVVSPCIHYWCLLQDQRRGPSLKSVIQGRTVPWSFKKSHGTGRPQGAQLQS